VAKNINSWRLVKFTTSNAFANMAIDEAILRARIEQQVPNTLRLYGWNPPAISIGRFQKIENEVHLENCRKLGVDVLRRISGGGTVFHDSKNEITYSVIAKTQDLGTTDVAVVYAKVYAGIAEALKILGITADFSQGDAKKCPNMTIKGKKISGSAQANKGDVALQHGTLLLEVDLEKMFTLLRVPWAKTCMEVVDLAKHKITSIRDELGRTVSARKVEDALIEGFEKALKTHLVQSGLTLFERELAGRLHREKYATDDWNFNGKSPLN
jgi:lipoate-protein ligase A